LEQGLSAGCSPVGEAHYFCRRSFSDLAEKTLPDRRLLDAAAPPGVAVMIQAWAPRTPNVCVLSSEGLARAGISSASPDRVGDVWIEKDTAGQPTGRLIGSVNNYYSHQPLTDGIYAAIPRPSGPAAASAVLAAITDRHAMGVTAVYEGHMLGFSELELYRQLRGMGALAMRVQVALEPAPVGLPGVALPAAERFGDRLRRAVTLTDRSDDWLRVDGVSASVSGPVTLGYHRSYQPYPDPYGRPTTGRAFLPPEFIDRALEICRAEGACFNTIACTSAEHDELLGRLESRTQPAADGYRAILQHAYFVDASRAQRYASLGVDVTTSCSFTFGKARLLAERLGSQVLADLIPFRRWLDAGVIVACGTDWGPASPWQHLGLALAPKAWDGSPTGGPAQAVTPAEALTMWTADAATVLRWPQIGSLSPGGYADAIVVDRNPLTATPDEIAATRVHQTWIGGHRVYPA
jgi:predicted amidohydrolase YtcJ